jgi:hypothetical protein
MSFEAGEEATVCSLFSRIDCNMSYAGFEIFVGKLLEVNDKLFWIYMYFSLG